MPDSRFEPRFEPEREPLAEHPHQGAAHGTGPSHDRGGEPDSEFAVTISGVHVRYGTTRALTGVDMVVPRGSITALLGPNGAGKSTTVGVICGLVSPDSGRVRVFGGDPGRFAARCDVSVMLQEGGIPTGAHAVSIVRHHAALRGAARTADVIIDELDLHALGRTTYRRMSGGQKRRVALACALVGHPRMVIVDEPTAGSDPQARRQTWQILDRLRDNGVTVLLSTHDLEEAGRLADHIVIIDGGRSVLQGPIDHLLDESEGDGDVIVFDGPLHLDTRSLRDALPPQSLITEIVPGRYRVRGTLGAAETAIVASWANQHGIAPHRIRSEGTTLEDLYFAVTTQTTTSPDSANDADGHLS